MPASDGAADTAALVTALRADGLLGEHSEHLMSHLYSLVHLPSREQQLALLKNDCGVSKLGHRIKIVNHVQRTCPPPDVSELQLEENSPMTASRPEPSPALPAPAPPPAASPAAIAAVTTTASAPAAAAKTQRWRVVHFPGVFIRAAPSASAAKVMEQLLPTWQEVTVSHVVNGWARLAQANASDTTERWMLVDGTKAGFKKPLLRQFTEDECRVLDAARQATREATRLIQPISKQPIAASHSGTQQEQQKQLVVAIKSLLSGLEILETVSAEACEREDFMIRSQLCVAYALLHPRMLMMPVADVNAPELAAPPPAIASVAAVSASAAASNAAASASAASAEATTIWTPTTSLADSGFKATAEMCAASVHVCAWEIMYTAHDGISRREINASHMQVLEQLMCFWAVASAAIGWLDLPKLRDGSAEVCGSLDRAFA